MSTSYLLLILFLIFLLGAPILINEIYRIRKRKPIPPPKPPSTRSLQDDERKEKNNGLVRPERKPPKEVPKQNEIIEKNNGFERSTPVKKETPGSIDKELRNHKEGDKHYSGEKKEGNERAREPDRHQPEVDLSQPKENLGQAEAELPKNGEKLRPHPKKDDLGGKERNGEKGEKKERVDPGKRGGRPRSPILDPGEKGTQKPKSWNLKPEIICWKRERKWILAVEVPEDLSDKSDLEMLQNGSQLKKEGSKEECWRLKEVSGKVEVLWNEDGAGKRLEIVLEQAGYILFKLNGQEDRGRHVKTPSFGSYLVVVPKNWVRDETLSGPPPVVPEPTSIVGYYGHYFNLEKSGNNRIGFICGTSSTAVKISPNISRFEFELVGNHINDADEGMGPLFGDQSPQIHALDEQAWKNVGTIVVGEEGPGKGRWRKVFSPVSDAAEQNLPIELSAGKGSWYFVRLYDLKHDLLESLDFRFVCGLKNITVHQPSPVPLESGHEGVRVEIWHEPDCLIQPKEELKDNTHIDPGNDNTILTIPPVPDSDKTYWRVGPKDRLQVEVTILVERIWWVVGEENEVPSEWTDSRLTLLRDDFRATSKKAIWVRLPRPRWIDTIWVGFDPHKFKPYPVKVTEERIYIPLRDFSDSQEVAERSLEHLLRFRINRDGNTIETVIAVIPVEHVEVSAEGGKPLNLSVLSAPRLASVLTELRRRTHGPLCLLIKEIRQKHPKRPRQFPERSMQFVKEALCLIAFFLEFTGGEKSQILGIKNHLTVKAYRANYEFPRLTSQLRNRYKELKVGYIQGPRRKRDGRLIS